MAAWQIGPVFWQRWDLDTNDWVTTDFDLGYGNSRNFRFGWRVINGSGPIATADVSLQVDYGSGYEEWEYIKDSQAGYIEGMEVHPTPWYIKTFVARASNIGGPYPTRAVIDTGYSGDPISDTINVTIVNGQEEREPTEATWVETEVSSATDVEQNASTTGTFQESTVSSATSAEQSASSATVAEQSVSAAVFAEQSVSSATVLETEKGTNRDQAVTSEQSVSSATIAESTVSSATIAESSPSSATDQEWTGAG